MFYRTEDGGFTAFVRDFRGEERRTDGGVKTNRPRSGRVRVEDDE